MKKLIATLAMVLLALPAAATVLFQDDFTSGPDDAWIIPNGGWEWSGGQYYNSSSCGFQSCMSPLFVGDPNWTSTTLKVDFTPTTGGVIYLMLGMSAPSLFDVGGTSGFCLDLGYNNNAIILENGSSPNGRVIAQDLSGAWDIVAGSAYTIEFGYDASNVFARMYPANSPAPDWQLQGAHNTTASGWCGFSTWHTLGFLDNVEVIGNGVVDAEAMSFGNLKALFR